MRAGRMNFRMLDILIGRGTHTRQGKLDSTEVGRKQAQLILDYRNGREP